MGFCICSLQLPESLSALISCQSPLSASAARGAPGSGSWYSLCCSQPARPLQRCVYGQHQARLPAASPHHNTCACGEPLQPHRCTSRARPPRLLLNQKLDLTPDVSLPCCVPAASSYSERLACFWPWLPYDPISGCTFKGNKIMERYLSSYIYCRIIHGTQDMETMLVSTDR